jgi:hypothetical protein
MAGKAVISLATGLEDPEKVTVAFLVAVAVGAAESRRPTLMFLTKEAVRLAVPGVGVGVACDGCPPLADLMTGYEARPVLRLPYLLQRKEARQITAHHRRRTARNCADVAVDRRRQRHHVQLLTRAASGEEALRIPSQAAMVVGAARVGESAHCSAVAAPFQRRTEPNGVSAARANPPQRCRRRRR